MNKANSISVIIPAYCEGPHLVAVIKAVAEGTTQPDEIIVSHSGTDDPTERLAGLVPNLRVLHSDAPLFAGAARNRGAAQATGEILAFCDEDTRPTKDWLTNSVDFLSRQEGSFVVGSVGVARRGGYWGMCNWLSEFSEQAPWHPARGQTGGASCNMALWRRDFESVSGMPEHQQGGEDTLFFKALREQGLQQMFIPSVEVQHFNIPGLAAFAGHQRSLGQHFLLTRLQADMPGSRAVRHLPASLLLWIAKSGLALARCVSGGPRVWALGLVLAPGVILGSWIWTSGLLAARKAALR